MANLSSTNPCSCFSTVCLHNYLRLADNAMYCPIGFVDSEDSSGEIREDEWRTINAADQGAFQNIETPRGRPQNDTNLERETLTSYFLTDRGSLPWQWQDYWAWFSDCLMVTN